MTRNRRKRNKMQRLLGVPRKLVVEEQPEPGQLQGDQQQEGLERPPREDQQRDEPEQLQEEALPGETELFISRT